MYERMLRRFHPDIKTCILDLYNRIWREEEISEEWKLAIVDPILKLKKKNSQVTEQSH